MKRDSNSESNKEPDWDTFEVYKGEEKQNYSKWLQRTVGVILIGAVSVGVFLLCGFLTAFVIIGRFVPRSISSEFSEGTVNAIFMTGGFLGILILAAWWFKTPTH